MLCIEIGQNLFSVEMPEWIIKTNDQDYYVCFEYPHHIVQKWSERDVVVCERPGIVRAVCICVCIEVGQTQFSADMPKWIIFLFLMIIMFRLF